MEYQWLGWGSWQLTPCCPPIGNITSSLKPEGLWIDDQGLSLALTTLPFGYTDRRLIAAGSITTRSLSRVRKSRAGPYFPKFRPP